VAWSLRRAADETTGKPDPVVLVGTLANIKGRRQQLVTADVARFEADHLQVDVLSHRLRAAQAVTY